MVLVREWKGFVRAIGGYSGVMERMARWRGETVGLYARGV